MCIYIVLSCSAEVAPGIPCTGSRRVSLLSASPTALAAVWPVAVRCCVAKSKVTIAPVQHFFPAHSAGYPPNFNVSRFK